MTNQAERMRCEDGVDTLGFEKVVSYLGEGTCTGMYGVEAGLQGVNRSVRGEEVGTVGVGSILPECEGEW